MRASSAYLVIMAFRQQIPLLRLSYALQLDSPATRPRAAYPPGTHPK